ncbi:hypothetical protein ATKI12_2717 [Kitasatospora sp. Ki12]|uniref:hypothetical protein n=1 Tax=Kitasatospora xanthocidica TaxID=83382 RepID=UPI001676AEC7|nr:hypothetical protein [Kitasatospora xanthocidica]GHF61474.1 hypothetical protein GCM10018790_44240 [Kitasatospora xanthocidica]
MRNGLVQLGAWAAATGAAVALSWFGVHAVLTGAAFEQPTALPLPSPKAGGTPSPATTAPEQPRSAAQSAPPAQPASPAAATTHGPTPVAPVPPPTRRPTPTAGATSTVKSYPIPGGKVALDLKPDHASLVSATPDPGWQMQVWNGDQWMRIDFTKDNQANSVFVYWNGHPPVVETAVR